MIVLHHAYNSVCSQKVRLALFEKGVEWQGEILDLSKGEQFRPAYMRMNPNAVVPTLVHDSRVVIESTVINEYIDDAFDGPALRPASAHERALMRLWTKQPDEGVHVTVNTLSFAIALRLPVLRMTPQQREARINGIPDPVRRDKMREMVERGVDSPLVDSALARFERLFGDMEAQLAKTPWLAGDTYSLADIGTAPYVHRLDRLGLSPMWSRRRPRVTDWLARLRARPAHYQAFADYELPEHLKLMADGGTAAWPAIAKKLGV